MKQRIFSLLLALCLLFSLSFAALAVEDAELAAAQTLNALGLFRGVGNDADGKPVFDLERRPNRLEAVTMLVRLLGKEEAANSGTWDTPFTDVDDWAKPYVGYAYANGLTNGTGATTFSGKELVTATQYLTFVLRALGYSSAADFRWDAAWELTDALGITGGQYSAERNEVTRGGMARISADTMEIPLKDSETSLIQKLVEDGAVTAEAAAEQGYAVVPEEPGMEIERLPEGLRIRVTNRAGLYEAVNYTEKVAQIFITEDMTVNRDCGISFEGDKLELYRDTQMFINEGVTVTVVEGGQLGAYWFTYEGNWDKAPTAGFTNSGTLIVEREGWINGEFTANFGTVVVRDGGQCQTIPKHNHGTVTVESGGSYRTTQGENVYNEGTVTIAEGANMVSRFGSSIINEGTIRVDGLLAVGCVTFHDDNGGLIEMMWFENRGTVTGSGTVRVYDIFEPEEHDEMFAPTDLEKMEAQMRDYLGPDTTLTIVTGVGSGV